MLDFVVNYIDWVLFAVFIVIAAIFAAIYRTRLIAYIQEVRQEWTRVSIPSREQGLMYTWVVVIGVAISAAYLFVVDWALTLVTRIFYRV